MFESMVIDGFLPAELADQFHQQLQQVPFEDGSSTAGRWARVAKRNKQAKGEIPQQLGSQLVQQLFHDKRVARSCYPHRAVQPLFNRYDEGDFYGCHEDNPIQSGLRADVSYTLFLSDPADYDGGELLLGPEQQPFKLPRGGIVMYSSGARHEVSPVTRGSRLAAVGWIQSVVPDSSEREMLGSFYRALDAISQDVDPAGVPFAELNRIRNQLMRKWTVL